MRASGRGAALAEREGEPVDSACALCARPPSAWEFGVGGVDAVRESTHEVLFTVGNGYFATRGTDPAAAADGVHYPGTYVAGISNSVRSEVGGRIRDDESVVNLPNWLVLHVRHAGGDATEERTPRITHDHRVLDMRRGVLLRESHREDDDGRRSIVREERFASMSHAHLGFLRLRVTAQNWSGLLRIESGIDGDVLNDNGESLAGLERRHLSIGESGHDGATCWLVAETTQSRVRIATATQTRSVPGGTPVPIEHARAVGSAWSVPVSPGRAVTIDKIAAIVTSRDHAVSEPLDAALRELDAAPSFPDARRRHADEWRHIWRRMRLVPDVVAGADADDTARRAVTLHLFHVAQTLSRHSADADVGVPARGLHGEGYRGHVFWDELFVFPMLNLHMPELTRALLLYRYRRLPEARRRATSAGEAGALFPWQSGADGRELTPDAFLNPRSGRWMADHSRLQFHVGLAVAYNVWHYFQVTGDVEFLRAYGAELIVEIARFWSGRAEGPDAAGRYHLRGMMGPDEFHDGYPDRPGEGIDDNAYVAVMTTWLLVTVLRMHRVLGGSETDDLWRRLAVTDADLHRWDAISRHLSVPFLANGLLAQFAGYEALAEIDLSAYRSRYGRIGRLDLILSAEGDSTNRYQVSKQADVLMLFYVFSAEELAELLERLGYRFDPQTIPLTIDYYLARTTHGSTLSTVAHAWVLSRGNRPNAWGFFRAALDADLRDDAESRTGEGVHLGAMAATADILQRCYTGLEVRDDIIHLHPRLPDALARLRCGLRYRGHELTLDVGQNALELRSRPGPSPHITVMVDGEPHTLRPGESLRIRRPAAPVPASSRDSGMTAG